MLASATERLAAELGDDAKVLEVGGWEAPFARADWVLDERPWESRGMPSRSGRAGRGRERFTKATWVRRDPSEHRAWPFEDDELDFAVCADTLAVVRDPVWVCAELSRVARRGYVEVPALEAELAWGVEGPWLGHRAHRWLVDVVEGGLVFTHKSHALHDDRRVRVPARHHEERPAEERVLGIFWDGTLRARERDVRGAAEHLALAAELAARVRDHLDPSPAELALREVREGARQVAKGAASSALERLRRLQG